VDLAKDHIDVGLFTNNAGEMLRFWQQVVELPFEELLAVGGGVRQHRHGMNGSVLKINEARDALPETPPSGYRELVIARDDLGSPVELLDPDGNRVTLTPSGHDDVIGIEMRMEVRDAGAFNRFFGEQLGLTWAGRDRYRCGDSLLVFEESPRAQRVEVQRAKGYRYLTIQVRDVDAAHAAAIAAGVEEGRPPVTLGTTARISFIRDPDGNWIELSQRASLTGPLPVDR
jgi:lactoylglutathione lyase